MKKMNWPLALAIVTLGVGGCGKGTGTVPVDPTRAGTSNPPAPHVGSSRPIISEQLSVDTSRPESTVAGFLEALRDGDDVQARLVLTRKAQEEAEKRNLAVAPPGSPTAKFAVGGVQFVTQNQDGAHVTSTWTDLDHQGTPYKYEIVWVLRREPTGWRIAGLITRLLENAEPLLLNFEDPDEMQRKKQAAIKQMERRAQDEIRQARQPDNAGQESLK